MAAQWYGARVGISGMFGKFEGRGWRRGFSWGGLDVAIEV